MSHVTDTTRASMSGTATQPASANSQVGSQAARAANTQRGRESETRVLKDMGQQKNTSAVEAWWQENHS
jgi:hypothetical protein